jgi:hypothetical protein
MLTSSASILYRICGPWSSIYGEFHLLAYNDTESEESGTNRGIRRFHSGFLLGSFSTMKMEAKYSTETQIDFQRIVCLYYKEDARFTRFR